MAEFFETTPNSLPKLPENYWELQKNEKTEKPSIGNIFDTTVKASLEDITNSIFKNKEN